MYRSRRRSLPRSWRCGQSCRRVRSRQERRPRLQRGWIGTRTAPVFHWRLLWLLRILRQPAPIPLIAFRSSRLAQQRLSPRVRYHSGLKMLDPGSQIGPLRNRRAPRRRRHGRSLSRLRRVVELCDPSLGRSPLSCFLARLIKAGKAANPFAKAKRKPKNS